MSLYRIAYHHVNHCVWAHTSSFNLNKHCNFHRNCQVAKLDELLYYFSKSMSMCPRYGICVVGQDQKCIFDKFRVSNELKSRLMTRKVRLISRRWSNTGRGCQFVKNAFRSAEINLCFNVALCTSRPPSQTSITPFITEKVSLRPEAGARNGFDMNLMAVSAIARFFIPLRRRHSTLSLLSSSTLPSSN